MFPPPWTDLEPLWNIHVYVLQPSISTEKSLGIQHSDIAYNAICKRYLNCPHLFSKPTLMFYPIILRELSISEPPHLVWDPLRFGNKWLCSPGPLCKVAHH